MMQKHACSYSHRRVLLFFIVAAVAFAFAAVGTADALLPLLFSLDNVCSGKTDYNNNNDSDNDVIHNHTSVKPFCAL